MLLKPAADVSIKPQNDTKYTLYADYLFRHPVGIGRSSGSVAECL